MVVQGSALGTRIVWPVRGAAGRTGCLLQALPFLEAPLSIRDAGLRADLRRVAALLRVDLTQVVLLQVDLVVVLVRVDLVVVLVRVVLVRVVLVRVDLAR